MSELQAALLAARREAFAAVEARPTTSPPSAPRPGAGPWLVGTHGGAGARCLAAVLPGSRYAGHDWPTPSASRQPVLLVCRSSQRGLASAQDRAREFRDGHLGDHLDLLGVVVSADAPGRMPPVLGRFERLLSGAAPILGEIPWQPTWRLGPPAPLAVQPPWLVKIQAALAAPARK